MDGVMDRGRPIVESTLASGALATISVVLRLIVKASTKAGLTFDDYWIVLSLLMYWAYGTVMIWGIFVGGGGIDMKSFVMLNMDGISVYLKVFIYHT